MFHIGDIVRQKANANRVGRVQTASPNGYGVEWFDGRNRVTHHVEEDIEYYASPQTPMDCFFDGEIGNYDSFLRTMTRERLSSPRRFSKGKILSDQILAFNASRTLFYPYQYKPLVKYISSESKRVLICDEVGLGKTIEAGLILLENMARVPTERVFIVCPSALREKWAQEMKNRFALDFSILSGQELVKAIARTREGGEEEILFGIVSYETVRAEKIIENIEAAPGFNFDLIIFDEAHRLRNTSTWQHTIAKTLCERADGVVMLTATPIQMKVEDLISLLRLLLPNEFYDTETTKILLEANEKIVSAQVLAGRTPLSVGGIKQLLDDASASPWFKDNPWMRECNTALSDVRAQPDDVNRTLKLQENLARLNLIGHVYTRTKKREVMTHTPKRNPKSLSVAFTPEEKKAYDAILEAMRAALEVKHPLIVSWIMNNIERRVASCLPAALIYFQEAMGGLSRMPDSEDREDAAYDTDESVNENAQRNAVNKFYDALQTKEWLQKQANKNHGEFTDSKAKVLLKLLDDLDARDRKNLKVIVFATFRKTLLHLNKLLLSEGYRVYTIHGGVPVTERPGIIEHFRDDDAHVSILLSSRVGGEGLDMQFTNIVVNYDLPWNPMEVEQRIGRIDRIGQEAQDIYIYHLFLDDTLEEKILKRLYDRIGVFEGAIGELEPIMGDVVKEVMESTSALLGKPSGLADAEYGERIDRILAKHKRDMEQLERESANFIGTDSFFTEEVKRIENRQLYITSEQLRLFFTNFLKVKCPSSYWDYDPKTKIGVFRPGGDFRELQQKFFIDEKIIVHRRFTTNRSYQITFDRDVAYKTPGKVEFINNLHPLVWLMMDVFERTQQQGQSSFDVAFHIVLEQNKKMIDLDAGYYVFEIGRIDIDSYIPYNRLELVILDDQDVALPAKKAEEMFAYILNSGRNPLMPLPDLGEEDDEDRKKIQESHERLHDVLQERTQAIKEEIERKNVAFIDSRRASLTMTYERKKRHLQEQIESRASRGESEKTLRLPKGQLLKLEEKYKIDVEALEEKRDVKASWEYVAFGILEVE